MSTLTGFPFIAEGSEGTPGLWNRVFSQLSDNVAAVQGDVLTGHFQQLSVGSTPPSYVTTAAVTIAVNSASSDYFYLTDSSGARSNYVIGSRAGGTADGLNIWDASGSTMLVSFSKQSIRFYQNVVGPVFDVGGALASTLNAATFGTGADSKESRIQAAISTASLTGIARVYLPASLLPYSAASISFSTLVQMVREGGNWAVFDVQAYGAAGDDVHDDTNAFIAAAVQSGAAANTLYVPSCTSFYKVTSTVTITAIGDQQRRWMQEPGGVIKSYVSARPTLVFAGVTATMFFTRIDGLNLMRSTNGHRAPLVQFGDANGFENFSVRNMVLNGGSVLGDGVLLHTAFNGTFSDCVWYHFENGLALTFKNDPAIVSGNVNFFNCLSDTAPIMFFVQEYNKTTNNLINSLHFDNCKNAHASGGKYYATTVAGSQVTGVSAITLTAGQGAASGVAAGDWVVVLHAAQPLWPDRVASVAGDIVSLNSATPFALTSGDSVIIGPWHTVLGGNITNVEFTVPHFERVNGVLGFGTQAVHINNPAIFQNSFLGANLLGQCQQWDIDRVRSKGNTSALTVLRQASDANNTRNVVRHTCFQDFNTNPAAILQVDGGTVVGWEEKFGLPESCLGVWHQDVSVAASQTNQIITGPSGAVRPLPMRQRGSLSAIGVSVTNAITAGTLTATAFLNGSASALSATIQSGSATSVYETPNQISYVQGDNIDVRITTTGGWLPTTQNVDVQLFGTI